MAPGLALQFSKPGKAAVRLSVCGLQGEALKKFLFEKKLRERKMLQEAQGELLITEAAAASTPLKAVWLGIHLQTPAVIYNVLAFRA